MKRGFVGEGVCLWAIGICLAKMQKRKKKKPREVNLPFNAMFLLKALPIK